MYKNILLQVEGAKATITLNRPEVLNALDWTTLSELEAALKGIEEDSQIRVVIIAAAGRAFCTGADLSYLKTTRNNPLEMSDFLHLACRVHNLIESLSKPVIAAVNGLALAGGLEMTLACDIVIASETARLGDQHANYGIIPGGGGTQRLPRIIGIRRAKELLLTGKWITATEAERIGLINQVVPPDKLSEAANELADKLASLSPVASRAMKELVNQGIQIDLNAALELEIGAVFKHSFTEDFREGLAAFKEKREPKFSGK